MLLVLLLIMYNFITVQFFAAEEWESDSFSDELLPGEDKGQDSSFMCSSQHSSEMTESQECSQESFRGY